MHFTLSCFCVLYCSFKDYLEWLLSSWRYRLSSKGKGDSRDVFFKYFVYRKESPVFLNHRSTIVGKDIYQTLVEHQCIWQEETPVPKLSCREGGKRQKKMSSFSICLWAYLFKYHSYQDVTNSSVHKQNWLTYTI